MVTGFILDLLLLKLQLNPAIFKRSICIYGLLTKCEVKMAGYWPSYLFERLWTETESIKSQKKKGQYPTILTQQAWPMKVYCMDFEEIFLAGCFILPVRVAANHSAGIGLSCPLKELAI